MGRWAPCVCCRRRRCAHELRGKLAAKVTLLNAGWVCASAAPPPVLAEAGAAALLALAASPPVLADAGVAALLASFASPPVNAWHLARQSAVLFRETPSTLYFACMQF